ncbi:MAG: Wzz/FepE/Etk N-terminal domain-containing protein, partial [Verrucomicrobiota bacterium]
VDVSPILDFRDLKSVIRKRFLWLVGIPALFVSAAVAYLLLLATPMYESTALVFVDPKFDSTFRIENVQGMNSDLDSLNSLERAITSDSMILRVVDKLDLRNDPGFLPESIQKLIEAGEPVSDSRLLAELRGTRVSASLIRPTRLLNLTVTDPNPVRAQKIAAAFVEEFEVFLAEQKRKEAAVSEEGLRAQAEEAYQRALEAETQLDAFRQNNPEFTVEQDHELFAERLSRMGEELNLAAKTYLDLRSRSEIIEELDPDKEPIKVIEAGGFSSLKQVADVISQQTAARAEFAETASQYPETSPLYKQAEAKKIDAEKQLQQLAGELKNSVPTALEAARRNEELLKERVSELQGNLATVKSASSKFRAIQQKVETEWLVHQNLQAQIGQTSLAAEKSSTIATVMSEPIVPHKPAKPNKPLIVLLAGFLGSIASLGVIGVDLLRRRPFVDRQQAEEHLNIPSVCQVPAPKEFIQNEQAIASELANIFYSPEHRNARLFHVTSVSNLSHGRHIASNLATLSAHHECPTLLISLMETEDSHGLVSFEPQQSDVENLYTLTLSSEILISPERTSQHLRKFYEHFGRIVIESTTIPHTSQVPAAFTSLSESNLLVISLEKDTRQEAMQTANQLSRHARAPIALILEG